jgi:hypothetical protein
MRVGLVYHCKTQDLGVMSNGDVKTAAASNGDAKSTVKGKVSSRQLAALLTSWLS